MEKLRRKDEMDVLVRVDTKTLDCFARFIAFTGADTNSAAQYLEATDWRLEEAVNIYMETSAGASPRAQQHVHSSADSLSSPDFIPPAEPDQGDTRSQAKSLTFDVEGIRAPDPSKRQRLVADDFESRFGNVPSHFSATEQFQDPFRDFTAEASAFASVGQLGSMNSAAFDHPAVGLAGMFQPPIAILFRGSFSDARQAAKQQKKWLLVNLQSPTEFASHTLNRDTWSDDVLQNVIANSFIFWQTYDTSEEGRLYSGRYQIDHDHIPNIAVIDPRTAEKLVEWSGFVEPRDLVEKLSDLCEHNSLDSFQPHRKVPAVSQIKNTNWERQQISNSSDHSENEHMEAAIAASLNDFTTDDPEIIAIDDDSDCEQETEDIMQNSNVGQEDSQSPFQLTDEPPDGVGVTRVQIRTADGQRIVRRFHKSDPVGVLFAFVRQEVPDGAQKKFQLLTAFPPVVVHEEERSIESAGLENVSLNMQWI